MTVVPLTKLFGIIDRPVGDRHAMEARSQLRHRPTRGESETPIVACYGRLGQLSESTRDDAGGSILITVMKLCLLLAIVAMSVLAVAQTSYPPGFPPTSSQPASQPPAAPQPASQPPAAPVNVVPSNPGDLATMLQGIEQETSGLNADVAKLRVGKWTPAPSVRLRRILALSNATSLELCPA